MLLEASICPPDESLVETARTDALLVAANQQDGGSFRVECKGDAPHTAIGAKTQLLHVRVPRAAQGIDSGPPEVGPDMLKQPDPRDQLDTHGL